MKEKNINHDTSTLTLPSKTKLQKKNDYDLINYDQYYSKTQSNIKTTTIASKQQQQQDLTEIWSLVAVNYLYEILKFDATSSQTILENITLSSSNIQYNCTHVNKHGVVTNTNNKLEDLPAWVMQAMTSLVHWSDFKKDHNDGVVKTKAHPSFRDVYNEVNNYFLDHKEPLLTKQLSKLFIKILRLFLQNTKQFEIEEFMRNLKDHLSTQTYHGDFNYIDTEMMDAMNEEGHDICCTQCLSTYDFVNNWLNCNEIEFNEFVLSLNANYKILNNNENNETCMFSHHLVTDDTDEIQIDTEPEFKKLKFNDESCTIVGDGERKLRRNNSFIAAITDNNNSNASSVSNKNIASLNQMFKTHSLDQISGKIVSKDDLSAVMNKPPVNVPKRTPSFNESQKIKNLLVNSMSLNNIATQIPAKFNKISVGALSSLISSVSLKDINNGSSGGGDNFTLGFDYDTFKHIIRALRICALCLPPINKRKLHLLLRLLYKLKFSEHAKLLVMNEFEQDFEKNMDYEMEYDNNINIESIVS